MIDFSKNFDDIKKGYQWKSQVDQACKKNMDAYTASVANETYLPQYSSREPDDAYKDRLKRAENAYMNFPEKIISIYQNSIYRSGEPNRESENDEFKRFINDVDGAGTHISDFVKNQVFVINEIHGGSFIVVDKPRKPDTDTLTQYQRDKLKFYPYCYMYTWPDLVNFGIDRYRRFDWVLFSETVNNETRYRYFDKTSCAFLNR